MSQNAQIVAEFCDAWKEKNLDRIMGFFTPDAVYTNIPIDPPNEGVEAIRKTIEGFIGMAESIEFVVHHASVSADGNVVMNERTDRFLINGKWVGAPVMGVFELRDGKISAWRDYFDMGQFQSMLTA